MRTLSSLGLLLGLTAIPMASSASVTDFVTNNSFEDVQISGGRSTNPLDVPGWTKVGEEGDALIWRIGYSDILGSVTTTGHGNQFVTLGCGFNSSTCGVTSWSQAIISLPAGAYDLRFDIAVEFGPGGSGGPTHTQSLTVSLSGGASASQVFSADGSVEGNYWLDWETKSLLFGANGAPVLLTFSTNNLQFDIGIDDVHIFAAIPEPEAYAMLIAGLGLLGFAARRATRRGR
jgi:hypothetical protein